MLTNVDNPEQHSKISVSEIKSLLRCSKQHAYRYREGLVDISPPSYFQKGTYLHAMLAEILKTVSCGYNPHIQRRFAQDVDMFSHSVLMGWEEDKPPVSEVDRLEIDAILKRFLKEVSWSSVDVLAVEQEFYADLGLTHNHKGFVGEGLYPVVLHGFIDAVIRDIDTGAVWIVEHKTAIRKWSEGQFQFDMQAPLYLDVWETLTGERPVGMLYNFFYPKTFEQRDRYISRAHSQTIREELQLAVDLRESGLIVRQPEWGCNGCSFRDLCFAEMTGEDASHLRTTRYKVDEDRRDRFKEE